MGERRPLGGSDAKKETLTLGSPVVPEVKMMIRSEATPSDAATGRAGGMGPSAEKAAARATGTSRTPSRSACGTPASATTRAAPLLAILWATRCAVSACQLMVTGTVPTMAAASRSTASSTAFSENQCTWERGAGCELGGSRSVVVW